MQTITIKSGKKLNKTQMHQVAFKKDGEPSTRVAFAVQGDLTIKQAKEMMMAAARKFLSENGFEKMVVIF